MSGKLELIAALAARLPYDTGPRVFKLGEPVRYVNQSVTMHFMYD